MLSPEDRGKIEAKIRRVQKARAKSRQVYGGWSYTIYLEALRWVLRSLG